jgi:hypothetical protein
MPFPKAANERCDRQQAERQREKIQHRDCDCTNTIWLKKASKADAIAGPCAVNSARPQRYIATIASDPNSTLGQRQPSGTSPNVLIDSAIHCFAGADQKREVRGEEDDDSGHSVP